MDLTTLARVRALLGFDDATDLSPNDLLTLLITSYSDTFERELDRHTLEAARTEIYRVRRQRRTLSLRAAPLTVAPTSIKYSTTKDFSLSTAQTENTDFTVDLELGLIVFLFSPSLKYGWVEIAYTGGMALDTAAFIVAFPAIAIAMDQQVAYHFQRKDNLAGTKVVEGGSTNDFDQLDLLEHSMRAIGHEKRRYL